MKKRILIFIFSAIVVIVAAFLITPDEFATILTQQQVVRDEVKAAEARFWQKLDYEQAQCHLCVHYCIIPIGERGICRVRENRGGRLYSLMDGLLAATQIAPIEKDGMKYALLGT